MRLGTSQEPENAGHFKSVEPYLQGSEEALKGWWQSDSRFPKMKVTTEWRMAQRGSSVDLRRSGKEGQRMEVWNRAAAERMKKLNWAHGGAW